MNNSENSVKQNMQSNNEVFVIAAGCGRQGTATLKAALETIYHRPCYDFSTLIQKHPDHVLKWMELDDQLTDSNTEEGTMGNAKLIKDLLQGYACTMDFPAISYYWQLMQAFPNAKVVITETDAESWMQAFRELQLIRRNLANSSLNNVLKSGDNGRDLTSLLDRVCRRMFGRSIDLDDDQSILQGLESWLETGQTKIPSDRLLVFSLEDGWKPLCNFLQVEIPNRPFPVVQSQEPAIVPAVISDSDNQGIWKVTQIATLVIAVGAIAIYLYKRRSTV